MWSATNSRAGGSHPGELRLAGPGPKGLIVQLLACAYGFGATGAGAMTVRLIDPSGRRDRPTPARLRARLGLTQRRSEAIAALAARATEREAAHKLGLGAPTLHTHVRRVYDGLDLHNRAGLLALRARHGFDTTPNP